MSDTDQIINHAPDEIVDEYLTQDQPDPSTQPEVPEAARLTSQTPAERLLEAATLTDEEIDVLWGNGDNATRWCSDAARDKALAAAFEVFEPVEQKVQVLLDALTPFTLEAYVEEVQLLHNALTAHAALKAGLEKG